MFSKQPKKSANIWGTFVRKVPVKNFQKSPNLVTLEIRTHRLISFVS